MSDQQKPEDRAPRPGAGDAARTQQIPRLGRDGKPVAPQKKAAPQKTVADALREARQSPQGSGGEGSTRRPAGPARPASTTRSTPAKGEPAKSDLAAPKKSAPSAQKPAQKSAQKPAQTSAPRDKAAPGASRPGSASDAKRNDAAQSRPVSKRPEQKSTAPQSAPAKGTGSTSGSAKTAAAAPAGRDRSSTPTAGDYARTTRQSPDSTSVIPAVKDDAPSSAAAASPASAAGRQARLRLTHVEPWSVTRLAFVVSVALMIVSVVAVTIFWVVLDLTGIWDQLNGTVTNVLSDSEGSFDLTDYLGLGRLVGLTLVFSAINVVLMTAIATIAAHLYNLAAQLLGGIQVTFSDD